MDLLFASDSLLVKQNMMERDRRVAEAGGNIAVAARKLLDEANGEQHLDPRRVSVDHANVTFKSMNSTHDELPKEKFDA